MFVLPSEYLEDDSIFFSIKELEGVYFKSLEFDDEIDPRDIPHRVKPRPGVGRRDSTYPLRSFPVGERAITHQKDVLEDALTKIFGSISDYAFEVVSLDILSRDFGGIGQRTPKSSDRGLDGIVRFSDSSKKDVLIQCKQWADSVGKNELEKFIFDSEIYAEENMLDISDYRIVFVSLNGYFPGAMEFASETDLILLDGGELASLAIKNKIGVEDLTFSLLDRTYWRDLSEI